MFTFTVNGEPVPQPRARISTRGGFGRAYVPSAHPIHEYRAAIAAAAVAAGVTRSAGHVRMLIHCVFVRPKSHFLKSGLRATAPKFLKSDTDNLLKGIMDALTGIAYEDDRQVGDERLIKSWGLESFTRVEIDEIPA